MLLVAGSALAAGHGDAKAGTYEAMTLGEDTRSQEQARRRVVVVGGANTDIAGMAAGPLLARDSNPGHVRISAGGVGRNIAENLARLGTSVHLISAFGSDQNARDLARACEDVGIDVAGSLTVPECPGAVYLSIIDEHGDLALALSDMRALDHLTPAALEARRDLLDAADLVVADTNLHPETLAWLAENAGAPVMVDAVSVAKAARAGPVLPRLHTLKASGLEAGAILGREVRNRDHAEEAARGLVSLGVTRAFVTSGAFGVAWADASGSGRMPAPSVEEVLNATGAGDAFAAGVAYATLEEWGTERAAAFGSACAAITLESEETVSDHMNLEAADERMKAIVA